MPNTFAMIFAAIAFAITFVLVRAYVSRRDRKRAEKDRQTQLAQSSRQVRRAAQRKGR